MFGRSLHLHQYQWYLPVIAEAAKLRFLSTEQTIPFLNYSWYKRLVYRKLPYRLYQNHSENADLPILEGQFSRQQDTLSEYIPYYRWAEIAAKLSSLVLNFVISLVTSILSLCLGIPALRISSHLTKIQTSNIMILFCSDPFS